MNPTAAGEAPVDRPVRPGPEAHKLTDRQIADMAFAVLREHNDNRLWRALTYDSGPYDVTTPTLALCHLARVFFAAGVAAALAGCVDCCGVVDEHDILECPHCGKQWTVPCNFDEDYS